MTGHKINVGSNIKIKDGKVIVVPRYRDASHAIAAKKSKKQRPVRRTV